MPKVVWVLVSVIVLSTLAMAACANTSQERPPSVEEGQSVFAEQCTPCHTTTRAKTVGPGLAFLMKRPEWMALPNGMPANSEAGVRAFLTQGSDNSEHPTFADLSDRQLVDLIAYLKTL